MKVNCITACARVARDVLSRESNGAFEDGPGLGLVELPARSMLKLVS